MTCFMRGNSLSGDPNTFKDEISVRVELLHTKMYPAEPPSDDEEGAGGVYVRAGTGGVYVRTGMGGVFAIATL